MLRLDLIPIVIIAAARLHNFKIALDSLKVDDFDDADNRDEENNNQNFNDDQISGQFKRNRILSML